MIIRPNDIVDRGVQEERQFIDRTFRRLLYISYDYRRQNFPSLAAV